MPETESRTKEKKKWGNEIDVWLWDVCCVLMISFLLQRQRYSIE